MIVFVCLGVVVENGLGEDIWLLWLDDDIGIGVVVEEQR